MTIIPISEGAYTVDRSKEFIPFNPQTDNLRERSRGSLLVEVQPFIVITSSDVLLLDTGLGFADSEGTMRLHRLMMDNGIAPSMITRVLLSHLHKDHTGGIMLPDKKSPAFENAVYYINRSEWEFAHGASSSYKPDDFRLLKNVELIEGSGTIAGYINYIFTGGHSRFHQAFKIGERGETVFFGGDVASQSQTLKTKYKAKYDYEPEVAMELRQQWRSEGEKNGWTFLFYHDIKFPVFHFERQ